MYLSGAMAHATQMKRNKRRSNWKKYYLTKSQSIKCFGCSQTHSTAQCRLSGSKRWILSNSHSKVQYIFNNEESAKNKQLQSHSYKLFMFFFVWFFTSPCRQWTMCVWIIMCNGRIRESFIYLLLLLLLPLLLLLLGVCEFTLVASMTDITSNKSTLWCVDRKRKTK